MPLDSFKIGELAKEAGVNVETVRFYERKGLVRQPSKASGIRRYPQEDVAKIRFIKRAQGLGFQLKEISDLLRWDKPGRISCSTLERKLLSKIVEIEQKMKDLKKIKTSLKELQNCCQEEDFSRRECSLSECLSDQPKGAKT